MVITPPKMSFRNEDQIAEASLSIFLKRSSVFSFAKGQQSSQPIDLGMGGSRFMSKADSHSIEERWVKIMEQSS